MTRTEYIENRTYDEIPAGDSANVPIVLTNSAESRAASCAIAVLMAHAKRKRTA
ncbi:MAG: hypothetical protein ACREU5_04420 [Burkholderiales bacterium]